MNDRNHYINKVKKISSKPTLFRKLFFYALTCESQTYDTRNSLNDKIINHYCTANIPLLHLDISLAQRNNR